MPDIFTPAAILMASLLNFRWQNQEEHSYRSQTKGDMTEKAKHHQRVSEQVFNIYKNNPVQIIMRSSSTTGCNHMQAKYIFSNLTVNLNVIKSIPITFTVYSTKFSSIISI